MAAAGAAATTGCEEEDDDNELAEEVNEGEGDGPPAELLVESDDREKFGVWEVEESAGAVQVRR